MENNRTIRVSGAGCCLIDRIYNNISFNSDVFRHYLGHKAGDGGLVPGKLEFEEPFEKFSGEKFPDTLEKITEGRQADSSNIGGPCIVALINAAQLTRDISKVCFYGCHGDDEVGDMLIERLHKTPVDISHYRLEKNAETASTTVFSDPDYDDGNGERIFVNTIGASWNFLPEELDEEFFESDITVFGATAIAPPLHVALDRLLQRAHQSSLTVVNTVFDSINERKNPDQRWPLGSSDESYRNIDVLVTDHEEALRLSGCDDIAKAMEFFKAQGVGAVAVTNGSKNVWLYSSGELFEPLPVMQIPVSALVSECLKKGQKGDTTGCGDNFAGGIISSLIRQLHDSRTKIDFLEACKWGVVSGGFACFYIGGTYFEDMKDQKLTLLKPLYDAYNQQLEKESLLK